MTRPASTVALLALASTGTFADGPTWPDYGLSWCVVGDPGNPDHVGHLPIFTRPVGNVDYTYRIMRSELTVGQWLEFVRAYAPFVDPEEPGFTFDGRGFTGWDIVADGTLPDGTTWYVLSDPLDENRPAEISWFMAARYCNWLHNGKVNEEWAFDDGAYDTSVFRQILADEYEGPYARRPGARYWLPSVDEWLKAGYWDPDRYGEGEGGYWTYPNGSEVASISGLPENGGETNAGDVIAAMWDWTYVNFVGLYPDVQSPWGLRDMSGSGRDWAEFEGHGDVAYVMGSLYGNTDNEFDDQVDNAIYAWWPLDSIFGTARIASYMPCRADVARPYGRLDAEDVLGFLDAFGAGLAEADLAGTDGVLDVDDLLVFLGVFAGGCE